MITGLSHVSIVVPNLDAAAKRLADTYGLTIGEISVNEQQGVRMAYVDLGNDVLLSHLVRKPEASVLCSVHNLYYVKTLF